MAETQNTVCSDVSGFEKTRHMETLWGSIPPQLHSIELIKHS